jgi:hypothetical protein
VPMWLTVSLWGQRGHYAFCGLKTWLANWLFFFLKIYFMYMSTFSLSSDAPEEGIRSHYRWL